VHGPGEIAGGEGNLGLRNLATGLGDAFVSAKTARGAAEKLARSRIVSELGHGNTAESEGGRVVPQRDALECTEGITSCQQARSRRDKRVHGGRICQARSAARRWWLRVSAYSILDSGKASSVSDEFSRPRCD